MKKGELPSPPDVGLYLAELGKQLLVVFFIAFHSFSFVWIIIAWFHFVVGCLIVIASH